MKIKDKTLLKYPRRKKRKIGNSVYEINPPSNQISKIMQNITSKNTSIEKILENELIKTNISFSKPAYVIGNIEGSPDFVIPKYKLAIFCDGDFWHGFNNKNINIKHNTEFWEAKIKQNIERDKLTNNNLNNQNWKVFRFWEHDIKNNASSCVAQIKEYIESMKSLKNNINTYLFTFVDLFAGIGGFRIPLEQLHGKCLGFSEIDSKAIEVYKKNFSNNNDYDDYDLGDITKLDKLPFKVDLIVGGVPCQSWSIAGKMRGFSDPRGLLWHDSIRVIKLNKPKVFIFENVKGLKDPRNISNLDFLLSSFESIGYNVCSALLNSYDFGVPQNRDRIFIVGIRKDIPLKQQFSFPKPLDIKPKLFEFIDNIENNFSISKNKMDPVKLFGNKVPASRNRFQKINELNDFFIFSDTRNGHTTIHSWDLIRTTKREKNICLTILRNRRKKKYGNLDGNPISFNNLKDLIPDLQFEELENLINKKILRIIKNKGYEFVNSKNSAGINDIYRVYMPQSDIFSTLTATGTKDVVALKTIDASEPEIYKENFLKFIIRNKKYRKITARESGRLQGFPIWFTFHHEDKVAFKQFGNAVSIPVVYNLMKEIIKKGLFKA